MTSAGRESHPAINSEAAQEMARYGITRVPVDYFHYGEFRYTNLKDAVAQASVSNAQRRARDRWSAPGLAPEWSGGVGAGIARVREL